MSEHKSERGHYTQRWDAGQEETQGHGQRNRPAHLLCSDVSIGGGRLVLPWPGTFLTFSISWIWWGGFPAQLGCFMKPLNPGLFPCCHPDIRVQKIKRRVLGSLRKINVIGLLMSPLLWCPTPPRYDDLWTGKWSILFICLELTKPHSPFDLK